MTPPAGKAPLGRTLLALVLAVEILAFMPALMQDGVLRAPAAKASDGTSQVYPWKIFWRDELTAGRPPLWNPFVFSGTPAFAEPQIQTFYPGNALWLVMPPETASKLTLLLHVMLASGLMFGLARAAGASAAGGAIAALAFGLHTQLASYAMSGWIQMIAPMAWAPGVLWALLRAFEGTQWRKATAAGGVLLGIQILSGHPEWVRYTLAAIAVLVLASRVSTLAVRSRAALVMVLLGTLVGAPQLLPTIEAASRSSRGERAIADGPQLHGAGMPVASLPTLLVPRIFGPWDLDISVDGLVHKAGNARVGFGESLVYVGILPLILAAVAVGRRVPGSMPWAAVALTGLALALNDVTHLQCLFDRIFPPDAMFRSPARFTFLANLALAVLVGLGVTSMERAGGSRRLLRVCVTIAALCALGGLAGLALRGVIVDATLARIAIPAALLERVAGGVTAETFGWWAAGRASLHLILSAVLLLMGALAVVWFARRPDRTRGAVLILVIGLDLAVMAWPFLTSVVDVDTLYARDLQVLAPLGGVQGARFDAAPGALDAGPNAGILARASALGGYDTFHLREQDRILLAAERRAEHLGALGVTHRVHADGRLTAVDGTLGRAFWMPASSALEDAAGVARPATIRRDEPGRLEVVIDAPAAGTLIVAQTFYPGWQAHVNGAAADVTPAFDMLQAVAVPAGTSHVTLSFVPNIVRWSFGFCAMGLVSAGILGGFRRRGAPRRDARSQRAGPA